MSILFYVDIDPYNLRVSNATENSITLTWDPPIGATGDLIYEVLVTDQSGCYSNTFTTNDTSLTVCGLDSKQSLKAGLTPINPAYNTTTIITVSVNGNPCLWHTILCIYIVTKYTQSINNL